MKKNYKIKSGVLILIILMLIVCQILISCGGGNQTNDTNDNNDNNDNNNNNNNQTPVNDDAGGATETPIEELYPYPEHDFGGAVINMAARKDGWADGSQDFDDLTVDAETGEVLNDSVYKRTKTVEEKYNVNIEVTYVTDASGTVSKLVKAGDDSYQIMQEKLKFISESLASQNLLYDFNTINSMNLDAPWYNQNAIKDLSINNKVTALGGDMTVSDKSGVIMTVFNKRMTADYGIENLYTTVREGKWTLDKLYELMMQTTSDLNGDGDLQFNDDQWGFVCEDYAGWMFAVASGNRLAALDDNGLPYMTAVTEKTLHDYERIKKILYETMGRTNVPDPDSHTNIMAVSRGFMTVNMLSSISRLRSMEEDFGIIPMPKQDETQKDYIATISPWVSRFIAMPSTCGDPEMVGAVIDAMSRESVNTVVPAYYENLLNQKIARDEESVEMLKMIFDSVIYDIGSVFSWGNIWDEQMMFIQSKKDDYAGNYERIQGRVEAALQKTIETMQQFD